MKYYSLTSEELKWEKWDQSILRDSKGACFHTPFAFTMFNNDPLLSSFVIAVKDESDLFEGFAQGFVQTVKAGLLAGMSRRAVLMQSVLYKDSEALDYLLKSINASIGSKTIYTEIRCSTTETEMIDIYRANGYIYEDHLDILVDLKTAPESIFCRMSKTRRKQINRGYNRGVHVDIVDRADMESIRACYDIVSKLYVKIGLPSPNWEVWKYAITHNPQHDEPYAVCFAAKFESMVIGTRVVLCFKKRIFDWYAGSMDEHYDKYPNDILPWEVFKWGHQNGFDVFDFGGAGKPDVPYGVRDYKLKFGGELVNYGRFKRVNSPIRYAIASRGFELLRKMKKYVI